MERERIQKPVRYPETIGVRVTAEMFKEIRKRAKERNQALSDVVRGILKEYFKN